MTERYNGGENPTRDTGAGAGAEFISGRVRRRVPLAIQDIRNSRARIFNGYSVSGDNRPEDSEPDERK